MSDHHDDCDALFWAWFFGGWPLPALLVVMFVLGLMWAFERVS
jgi:hypothetical protein